MFLTAKTAQALQHVQSALRLDPGHEPAMRLRKRVKDVDRLKDEGNSAFKVGKLEEAIARYSESLEVRIIFLKTTLYASLTEIIQRIGESDEEGRGEDPADDVVGAGQRAREVKEMRTKPTVLAKQTCPVPDRREHGPEPAERVEARDEPVDLDVDVRQLHHQDHRVDVCHQHERCSSHRAIE